jgi:acetyl-CoA C-acetyltransferase
MPEAFIIDAVRSPRGRGKAGKGGLADVHPQRVLAQVLQALAQRNGLETADVDDVIMGCSAGSGDHAMDIARMAVLDAGWSLDAPGVTLNRFCGSGQQAVNFAALGVLAGHQDLVVGGGVESMSRYSPMHVDGFSANNPHLQEKFPMVPQGISADLIASLRGFSRQDCDDLALESQRRAGVAIAEGRFEKSIVPIHHDGGGLALDHDEHPRPSTTAEDLSALRASFEAMGAAPSSEGEGAPTLDELARRSYPEVAEVRHVHHAGNSSGVVDGAGAVLVASPDYARAHGLTPRARIVMTAVAGTEPVIMLTAPVPATERVLAKAGMALDDIDLFEVNEAFAAVVLDWFRGTGVDPAKVNVNGGAIALGHPIGATGSMLIGTVLDELERRDLSTGLVTMCTGGGMGTATIIERI